MGAPLGIKSTNVGVIKEIRDLTGNSLVPFDHIVLSATGAERTKLKNNAAVGDQVQIAQEISNCLVAQYPFDYTNTYAGLGGDYHFLSNGVIRTDFSNPDAAVANSRTAVGFNAEYVFFVVVDAFNKGVSEGMKIAELADFFKNTLGASWAVSLDSGGSSTMVVNGAVVNNTTCNFTRDCGMRELVDGNLPIEPYLEKQYDPLTTTAVEPLVGDAMMMVSVLPRALSATFVTNQAVLTLVDTALRLGPGENYGRIITIPSSTQGSVLAHGGGLNGVRAKGGDAYAAADAFWWKINFNGQIGWVREDALWGGTLPGNENAILVVTHSGPTVLGEPTNFLATFTGDTIDEYSWNFGDGNIVTTTSPSISHQYAQTGNYDVVLTATNSQDSYSAQTMVYVGTPVAGLLIGHDGPNLLGTDTNFFASFLEGSDLVFDWDFGDGTKFTTSSISAPHQYSDPGQYSVVLTASNPLNSDSALAEVEVIPPISNLVITHNGPTLLGENTDFIASHTDSSNVEYTWDFGDGSIVATNLDSISHQYTALGVYRVILTATNLLDTEIVEADVHVVNELSRVRLPWVEK